MQKKNTKIKFRNALISDAIQLANIEQNIFPLDKVNTNFEREIEKDNKKIFVCTSENTVKNKQGLLSKIFKLFNNNLRNQVFFHQEEIIVGYVKIWKIMEDLHIEQIGVLESFQRQGIGEKLLKISINYSIQESLNKIILECRESNAPAINLYKKYLFKITSIRKNYYPLERKREDAICFESQNILENSFYKNL
jgi:ribosomal-protein-alanine N-acetyltransferase